MALDFMKFHISAAVGLKSGQSDRKRKFDLAPQRLFLYFWIKQYAVAVKVPIPLERLCPYTSMTPGCP